MNHCDHDQVLSVLREMQYELFLSIGHSAQEGSFLQGISNKCKASCMSVCSKTINSAVVEFTQLWLCNFTVYSNASIVTLNVIFS